MHIYTGRDEPHVACEQRTAMACEKFLGRTREARNQVNDGLILVGNVGIYLINCTYFYMCCYKIPTMYID